MKTIYEQCAEALRQQLLQDSKNSRTSDGILTTVMLGERSPDIDAMLGSGRTK